NNRDLGNQKLERFGLIDIDGLVACDHRRVVDRVDRQHEIERGAGTGSVADRNGDSKRSVIVGGRYDRGGSCNGIVRAGTRVDRKPGIVVRIFNREMSGHNREVIVFVHRGGHLTYNNGWIVDGVNGYLEIIVV